MCKDGKGIHEDEKPLTLQRVNEKVVQKYGKSTRNGKEYTRMRNL